VQVGVCAVRQDLRSEEFSAKFVWVEGLGLPGGMLLSADPGNEAIDGDEYAGHKTHRQDEVDGCAYHSSL
jgi:hypothetical protein